MQATLIFKGGLQVWNYMTDKVPTKIKEDPYAISVMARDYKGVNNHGMNVVVEVYELEDEVDL